MPSETNRKGGLVVADRPQISVELVNGMDIEISVSRIGDSFDTVDTQVISFPADVAKDVAKAILALVKR